jgi:hypothetical protein
MLDTIGLHYSLAPTLLFSQTLEGRYFGLKDIDFQRIAMTEE